MSLRKLISSTCSRKLVVVGNKMCGKTSLLNAFKDNRFSPNYESTIFETYVTNIQVDEKNCELILNDTAGEENYDRLRPVSYSKADIILICFNIDNPVSAINIMEKWISEVRHFCALCPIIVVACKTDLRTDYKTIAKLKCKGERIISTETGKQIATYIKADAYMECSAKTGEGVDELFEYATRLSLRKRPTYRQCAQCSLQ